MQAEAQRRLIEYYNTLYRKHGQAVQSLGWSAMGQVTRFARVTAELPHDVRSLLDVGCGFGQLADYLAERRPEIAYTGYEINPNFLAVCRERTTGSFAGRDIIDDPPPSQDFDVAVAVGILNTDTGDNEALVRTLLQRLYDASAKVAILSATSRYVDDAYRQESAGMYYYDPAALFTFAKTIARNVDLLHSYLPHDFLLVLHR